MATFGQWEYTCDSSATEHAYLRAGVGGAESCGCNTCRNFVAVRDKLFPPECVALLHSLGVKHTKDAEVYHLAKVSLGRHQYGGWYHFVGRLEKTGDFPMMEVSPSFKVWMCKDSAPHLKALEGLSRVQLEFVADDVPWVLHEPEPQ
jgi:hypothetical protein